MRQSDRPARWSSLPYLLLLAVAAAAVALMRYGGIGVRAGTLAVAVVMLVGGLARLVLPEQRAGMLASRSRPADVAAFTVLGVSLLVGGLIFPAQS